MKKILPVCAAFVCAALLCSCDGENEPHVSRPARTSGETYTIPRVDITVSTAMTEASAVGGEGAAVAADGFSCGDITAEILASVNMSSMAEVGPDRVGMYIDCEIPEGTDFSFFICGSGGFADEVCVINVAGVDTEAFSDAVNRRIEARMNDFEDYNPDEYQKLTEMFTKQTGDYLIYAVTEDNGECERIFDEFTGG
ncbi:MAG: DUF4358 domain-containing protein [Oscillospiraceae bacterium]|nr:DUF4358 domain-containing protein [Oscillospiraceae bacterium]